MALRFTPMDKTYKCPECGAAHGEFHIMNCSVRLQAMKELGEDKSAVSDRLLKELDKPKEGLTMKTKTDTVSALDVQISGAHYKSLPIQPVEYIHANKIGYFEGNVIKYVSRWKDKGGIADLEKAKHYIELLIELERKSLNNRHDNT